MQRNFYYGLFVFLFYVVLSTITVKSQNPNPLIISVIITILTFFWFRISVNWEKLFSTTRDVFLNILVYSAILSIFAFLSILSSRDAITFTNLFLYISSVGLWIFIWTDYYFQRMKEKS